MADSMASATVTTSAGGPSARGPHHERASATEAFSLVWSGATIRRWIEIPDASRVLNSQICIVGNTLGSGFHEISGLCWRQEGTEMFVYSSTEPQQCSRDILFERPVFGPSRGDENAISVGVEHPSLSTRFLDAFRPVLAQLTWLAQLEEGWDSYGAPRIEEAARYHAALLLGHLYNQMDSLPLPIVGPSPSGSVVLEWRWPDLELRVHAGSDVCDYYVAHPDEDDVRDQGAFRMSELDSIAQVLLPVLRRSGVT